MSDIKAVIFDLDGTLYDYYRADDAACAALGQYVCEHFGMDPGSIKNEIKACWDIQNDRIGFLCGATHNRLIRCQVLCERNGWPIFPHSLKMAETYWKSFLDGMVIETGIREFLTALQRTGVDISIGSNMTSAIQYMKLMKIGLTEYFDHITMSEETGLEKPEKKFYEVCARKALLRYDSTGIREAGASTLPDIGDFMSRCLFIGDSPAFDYFGPLHAGMQACLYLGAKPKPDGVDGDRVIISYTDCIKTDGILIGRHFIPYK